MRNPLNVSISSMKDGGGGMTGCIFVGCSLVFLRIATALLDKGTFFHQEDEVIVEM